ncbi:MAG: hypothetical protein ACXWRA_12380, partial [Pseudobdellovibrionaceae bacterium]
MKKISIVACLWAAVIVTSMLTSFQNCGPAKLQGESGNGVLPSSTESGLNSSLVGTQVDLSALLASSPEDPNNIIYPSSSLGSQFEYAQNSPLMENIILRVNDFTRIIWVNAATSTIVAVGDAFNQKNFTSDMQGVYYVFGFRNQTSYLITKLTLASRAPATSNLTSQNAVFINQVQLFSDAQNE